MYKTTVTKQEIQNLVDSVNYNIHGINMLVQQRAPLTARSVELSEEIDKCTSRVKFLGETKEYYVKAVDLLYEESIGALKTTLNSALQYIMYDKNYTCNIIMEDTRGTKTIELSLYDKDLGFEVDLRDGAGQGVRTIISFILKAYYLINKDSKILFLDEKYSALSEHYIPRFFEFMKELATEKGLIIVLITHDNRFSVYADKTYTVNDGNVEQAEENSDVKP